MRRMSEFEPHSVSPRRLFMLGTVESVTVQLDDGASVDLSRSDAERLYDLLWRLAPDWRGAVTAAAKLHRALKLREPPTLDAVETAVFLAARDRL
jgi:hypothetical protein